MNEKIKTNYEHGTCKYCGGVVYLMDGYKDSDGNAIHYRRFCADKSRARYKKDKSVPQQLISLNPVWD